MPEAAVNEDDQLVTRQHDVGPAGQVMAVKTVGKPFRVQDFSEAHLGRWAFGADPGHVPASLPRSESVCHAIKLARCGDGRYAETRMHLRYEPEWRAGISRGARARRLPAANAHVRWRHPLQAT